MQGFNVFADYMIAFAGLIVIMACIWRTEICFMEYTLVSLLCTFVLGLYIMYKLPKWVKIVYDDNISKGIKMEYSVEEYVGIVGFIFALCITIVVWALVCSVGFVYFRFVGVNWAGLMIYVVLLLLYGGYGIHLRSYLMCGISVLIGMVWLSLELALLVKMNSLFVDEFGFVFMCVSMGAVVGSLCLRAVTVNDVVVLFLPGLIWCGTVGFFVWVTLFGLGYPHAIHFWPVMGLHIIAFLLGCTLQIVPISITSSACCMFYLYVKFCNEKDVKNALTQTIVGGIMCIIVVSIMKNFFNARGYLMGQNMLHYAIDIYGLPVDNTNWLMTNDDSHIEDENTDAHNLHTD